MLLFSLQLSNKCLSLQLKTGNPLLRKTSSPVRGMLERGTERNHYKRKRRFVFALLFEPLNHLTTLLYVGWKRSPRTEDGLSDTPRKGVQSRHRTEDGTSPPKRGIIQSGLNLCGRLTKRIEFFLLHFCSEDKWV